MLVALTEESRVELTLTLNSEVFSFSSQTALRPNRWYHLQIKFDTDQSSNINVTSLVTPVGHSIDQEEASVTLGSATLTYPDLCTNLLVNTPPFAIGGLWNGDATGASTHNAFRPFNPNSPRIAPFSSGNARRLSFYWICAIFQRFIHI